MKITRVITIDGPAASGKSSVSRQLAKCLGWSWVSTGAFYRGLALVAGKLQVNPLDGAKVATLIGSSDWFVRLGEQLTHVFFQGEDVTDQISSEAVGAVASQVSQYPEVRAGLLEAQRRCAVGVTGLIAEGRDCGSVVFPEAPLKIYLTANDRQRALRRAIQEGAVQEEIQKAQKIRDTNDSERKVAPLKVPDGGTVIDTSQLTLDEVVHRIEELARDKFQLTKI